MSLSDCAICWETHCRHQCPPHFQQPSSGDPGWGPTPNCNEAVRTAVEAERDRIMNLVVDEARRYSREKEMVSPAEIALVFANAVRSKVRDT